jgi:hypothetical protein
MYRPILSLLLITGYLAGQFAGFPHVHAAEPWEPSRPHAHGDWLIGWFHTGEPRNPEHQFHHYQLPDSRAASVPGHDHDDRIYLPDLEVTSNASKTNFEPQNICSLDAIVVTSLSPAHLYFLNQVESRTPCERWLCGCPRFLTLRTLRI